MKIKIKRKIPTIKTEGNIVAFDTETTGLDYRKGDRPYLFTFTDYEGNNTAIWGKVDKFTRSVTIPSEALKELKRVLEDPTITKVCHNAKFDLNMARSVGINVQCLVYDTLIFAHVFNSNMKSFGLKPLADYYLGFSTEDQEDLKKAVATERRKGRKLGWALGPKVETDYFLAPELCEKYGVSDTERTMQLFWGFEEEYNSNETYRETVEMEHELLWVTRDMEDRGIRCSVEMVRELQNYYQSVIDLQSVTIKELGFETLNINSPKQMKEVFYDQLNMETESRVRKKDGKRTTTVSVDGKALQKWALQNNGLGSELAKTIIRLREAEHQLSSFVNVFEEVWIEDQHGQKIIHPNYKTCGPVTGRLSCTKPNLMNISNPGEKKSDVQSRVRECFIPREDQDWVLYFADYSQVEVWVAMYLSKDEYGMQQLENGEDMHGNMAKKLWSHKYDFEDEKVFKKWRKNAKFVLFGLIYGAGIPAVMNAAGCDEHEAKEIRDVFWKTFPGLYAFSKRLQVQVEKLGYITNPFGRNYHISADEAYKSLNYMIQGTAAEIMKRALINLSSSLRKRVTKYPKAKLLLTIHDEVCVEAHKKDKQVPKLIVEAMQGEFHKVLGLPCKIQAEISIATESWAKKKTMETQFN